MGHGLENYRLHFLVYISCWSVFEKSQQNKVDIVNSVLQFVCAGKHKPGCRGAGGAGSGAERGLSPAGPSVECQVLRRIGFSLFSFLIHCIFCYSFSEHGVAKNASFIYIWSDWKVKLKPNIKSHSFSQMVFETTTLIFTRTHWLSSLYSEKWGRDLFVTSDFVAGGGSRALS